MNIMVVSADDDVFVPFVGELARARDWRVTDYFLGYSTSETAHDFARLFPGCRVHANHDASRGLLPQAHRHEPYPELDAEIIEKMRPYEQMAMRMFDIYDPDGRSFSPLERRSAYYHVLRFGLYFMRNRRPDLLLAGSVPNSLHDFMLYCLCRVHGIPTYVYYRTPVDGLVLVYTSLEEAPRRLARAAEARLRAGAPELPPLVEQYYRKVQSTYDVGKPWYMKFRNHEVLTRGSGPGAVALSYLRDAKWLLSMALRLALSARMRRDYLVTPQADFFKQPDVPFSRSMSTRMEQALVFRRGFRRKLKLLATYRGLQVRPDLDAPYVFVPLHFQPEASTYPMGWDFIDQELMIRLLAALVPKGWRILVKEHLVTFDPGRRSEMSRLPDFYRELAAIDNVDLVPMELESFAMIDRARCVATITGTVGLEALIRGKPVITFGPAWYAACPGVLDGRDREACRAALGRVAEGYAPDQESVRRFLAAFAEVALHARRENVYPLFPEVTPEENTQRILVHFLEELHAQQSKPA
jgi:hypothetical protein